MTGELLAFFGLSLAAIVGGVLLLNLTKVVHMVLSLVLTFVAIAGIYVLLSAEFVAGVQILIYSGAITIIMLFGIMLTRHNDEEEPKAGRLRKLLLFLGVVGFAAAFYFGIYDLDFPVKDIGLHEHNTEKIGKAMYSKFVIPFEVTSVVLLVALVGAVVLSKKDDEKEAEDK
jgi:NADH-quinone oxidoreductase subunit J